MAKITRVQAKVFGQNAAGGELGVFGSLAAGTPTTTTSVATIQSLAAWLGGWFSAVVGENSPAIEDMNAMCYVFGYQIAYGLQTGVPEWETNTVYYIGSFVSSGNKIYVSQTDANTGNAVTSTTNWALYGNKTRAQNTSATITTSDNFVYATPAANIILTMDTVGTFAEGQEIEIKNTVINGFTVTVASAALIDGQASIVLGGGPTMDSVTLKKVGTTFYIV